MGRLCTAMANNMNGQYWNVLNETVIIQLRSEGHRITVHDGSHINRRCYTMYLQQMLEMSTCNNMQVLQADTQQV